MIQKILKEFLIIRQIANQQASPGLRLETLNQNYLTLNKIKSIGTKSNQGFTGETLNGARNSNSSRESSNKNLDEEESCKTPFKKNDNSSFKFFYPYRFIWEFRYNEYRIFRPRSSLYRELTKNDQDHDPWIFRQYGASGHTSRSIPTEYIKQLIESMPIRVLACYNVKDGHFKFNLASNFYSDLSSK
ncbi:hypothetical protein BpHYR1_032162 [Brachionus plicatilis]|uniref:Uncharacterized protein n=1 Tax=Brachionus plicatilis TaxID=10195 RepID=A0A3M7Q974_BRAPC|nr:hypothetical protein BpHYR1_032162 [Brachionus plicatilis]